MECRRGAQTHLEHPFDSRLEDRPIRDDERARRHPANWTWLRGAEPQDVAGTHGDLPDADSRKADVAEAAALFLRPSPHRVVHQVLDHWREHQRRPRHYDLELQAVRQQPDLAERRQSDQKVPELVLSVLLGEQQKF